MKGGHASLDLSVHEKKQTRERRASMIERQEHPKKKNKKKTRKTIAAVGCW
jgi:hypothetical protein